MCSMERGLIMDHLQRSHKTFWLVISCYLFYLSKGVHQQAVIYMICGPPGDKLINGFLTLYTNHLVLLQVLFISVGKRPSTVIRVVVPLEKEKNQMAS